MKLKYKILDIDAKGNNGGTLYHICYGDRQCLIRLTTLLNLETIYGSFKELINNYSDADAKEILLQSGVTVI